MATKPGIYAAAREMYREMHAEWENVNESEFERAEEHCRGFMARRINGIAVSTNREVWGMCRSAQLKRGTEELNEYLEAHPQTRLAAFERQWMQGRVLV